MISVYRPGLYVSRITCPGLIMYAKDYMFTPWKTIEKAGAKILKPEVIGFPIGHFDVSMGELFHRMVQKQAEFLLRHLSGDKS